MPFKEEMIRVRTAYGLIGELPLQNFPKAARIVELTVALLDHRYAACWGAPLGVDLTPLDGICAAEVDFGLADSAWEFASLFPRESYADTRGLLIAVVEYLASDIRLKWEQAHGKISVRTPLRLVDGGLFARPSEAGAANEATVAPAELSLVAH